MDEIEIWAIEESQVVSVERSKMELESTLEDTLAAHPSMLLPNLKLVGRQMPVAEGYLDLLGVDDEGKLTVFELKRGTISRDAVAQVIDYGSALEAMSETDLAKRIDENSGQNGIDDIGDFVEWYRDEFGKSLDSLRPLRMFLVGLGTDETAKRMVDYLVDRGVDVSLLTFYGFEYSGNTLLARQVQVESVQSTLSSGTAKAERSRVLAKRAEELGVDDLLASAKQMILDTWKKVVQGKRSGLYEDPGVYGITFKLPVRRESGAISSLAFISIALTQEPSGINGIAVRFYPRAIDLCKEKFDQLDQEDGYHVMQSPPNAQVTERVKEEVFFLMDSFDEWEVRREKLKELTLVVFEAWMDAEESRGPAGA